MNKCYLLEDLNTFQVVDRLMSTVNIIGQNYPVEGQREQACLDNDCDVFYLRILVAAQEKFLSVSHADQRWTIGEINTNEIRIIFIL